MRHIRHLGSDAANGAKSEAGNRSIYGTCCRVFAAAPATRRIDEQEYKAVEGQMSATLERAASGANENRSKPNKIGIRLLTTGLGEGFEIVFAGCVLLVALWLLAFGYA
jgi:hypothetical protein